MPINIDINRIRVVIIDKIVHETPTVKTIVFKDRLSSEAKPGQFLMVWIPRGEELPMSVMVPDRKDKNNKDSAALTIRKHGYGSTLLFDKRPGDILGVRGPYGNEFKIGQNKKVLLVGGGTGLVPLMRLARKLNRNKIDTTIIIGARTKEEVFFERMANDLLRNTRHQVIVTTEDGSYGEKGYATDAMARLVDGGKQERSRKNAKFDCVYTCGPELMMKKVYDLAASASLPVQASLERYMKCGIGICSSCCIGDQLVCRDGTIYNERQLSAMAEFGRIYRDKSGRRVPY